MKEKIRTEVINQALEYLSAGYSIIPVGKNKKPLIRWKEYRERRPTKEEVIAWFTKFPDMNIGIVTGKLSGLVVVDIEKGGSVEGYPATATVQSGGKGYHLYYQYPEQDVHNTTRFAELTDIRGEGGYVVAPPSIGDKGAYIWTLPPSKQKIAPYPAEIIESKRKSHTKKPEPAPQTSVGSRNTDATSYAGKLVSNMPKDMWNTECWDLLQVWNQRLTEPLPIQELEKTFVSVKKMANLRQVEKNKDKICLKPFTLNALYEEEMPELGWAAKGLIPFSGITAITGPSNVYKSFLTLSLAQAVASGTPFLDKFETKQGKVLIIDEENHRQIIRKRFEAMGVEASENIVFLSQNRMQLDKEHHVDELLKLVSEIKPRLIVFDSLVRFHSRDENSATEMSKVMDALLRFVSMDRAIVFIHHNKKEQGYSKTSNSGSVRGSTDIFNALDCNLSIDKKSDNTLIITMNKLRVQEQLQPFKVTIDNLSEHLNFTHEGEDTSRTDAINELKGKIVSLLEEADEPLVNRILLKEIKTSDTKLRDALKELKKENITDYTLGPKGVHQNYLVEQVDAPDLKNDEIPY